MNRLNEDSWCCVNETKSYADGQSFDVMKF
jgi:hypothetical protein